MEYRGLTQKQVEESKQKFGENKLPDREKKNLLKIAFGIITEPMIFMLIAVVVIYLFLGDWRETVVLALSVIGVISLEMYQDSKTEHALESLRSLSEPQCEVIRDGKRIVIENSDIVVGDVFVVSEGNRVAADGVLLESHTISANESVLTGESMPVNKNKDDKVYSGSTIVSGTGIAKVTAVGVDTEIGHIGTALNAIKPEKTRLQKETNNAVRIIAIGAICLAALLTVSLWLLRGDLLHGFLAGLTLSIAILPEEFPVVLTVFMALGAWRLAKSNVLARRNQTIETLGSATVLCTDKTGTLTQNNMSVAAVYDVQGKLCESKALRQEILSCGVLASQQHPFDPMETAILSAAGNVDGIYGDMQLLKEYAFTSKSFSVAHAWGTKNKAKLIALKGAPEEVFRLCRMPQEETKELDDVVAKAAHDGLRVLAVARGSVSGNETTRDDYTYKLLGFIGFADPIRPEVKDAVKLAHDAGVRVVMITGDYAETARRIGREIGIKTDNVSTGEDFLKQSEEDQRNIVQTTEIFSRVSPQAKFAIITALKKNGEVVAMTGDGVNDGPALKSADIGIAMGKRGTDVAREAASIVLLDDNFASIVQGVRIGRRIFANLQKAMMYLMIVHIPIAVLSIVPVFFGWSLILLPIHIVFFEFIIDPSCTLVFEGESDSPDSMKRPPRKISDPLFSKSVVIESVVMGSLISVFAVITHAVMLMHGFSDNQARAMTYLIIALSNIGMILALSGRRVIRQVIADRGRNALSAVVVLSILVLTLIYSIPLLRDLFSFSALSSVEVFVAICAAGCVSIATGLVRKRWH